MARPKPTHLLLGLLLAACGGRSEIVAEAAPQVAGLAALESQAAQGRVLMRALRCGACHEGAGAVDPGPDLSKIGERLDRDYVASFLIDPHGTEPGTVMPDLDRRRSTAERGADAHALAAFLFSAGGAPAATGDLGSGPDVVEAGRRHFHELGCAACHAPLEGPDGDPGGSAPMADVARKYHLEGLRAFLLDPLEHRPSGRMPDLALTPAEAHAIAVAMGARPAKAVDAPDEAFVRSGRERFTALGCASCHAGIVDDAASVARPLAALDASSKSGCLSGEDGAWPSFDLTADQVAALRAALAAPSNPDGEEGIAEWMAARQCFACHARGGRGGVVASRDRFFTTVDERTGSASRLPPPLDHVGEKLTTSWLQKAIAHGQEQRAYVTTRMPGFGAAYAAELAPVLTSVDGVPDPEYPAAPASDEERRAVRDLGMTLVGDRGLNCIACHTFGGESVGAMAAIDLAATTGERLTRGFFHRYLREPTRYRPDTLMPTFFAGGKSPLPELAEGDIARQIDAMWTYLAEGRNTRRPPGLRSPPVVLEVADRPVILRRRLQRTGKRGISVGLPGGVNFAFDAETLALHQVWWGDFLDASPVFHGQGSGEARILSRDLAVLPLGPAVVALGSGDEPWPTATRRELGQGLLGYDLDAGGFPTFRYALPGVSIEDTARPAPSEGGPPDLVRKMRFTRGDGSPDSVTVLVARDPKLVSDGTRFRVGDRLGVTIVGAEPVLLPAGDAQELRVPVRIGAEPAEISITYSLVEEGR